MSQHDAAAEIPIASGPTADPLYGPIGRSASSGSGSTGVGSAGSASGASGNAQGPSGQTTITGGTGGFGYGTQANYPPSYTIVIHDPQIGDRVFGPFGSSIDAYAAAARYHQKYLYGSHMTTTLILLEDPTTIP